MPRKLPAMFSVSEIMIVCMVHLIAGISYIYCEHPTRTCRRHEPSAPGPDRRHVPADVRRRHLADLRCYVPSSSRARYSLAQLGMLWRILSSKCRLQDAADGKRWHAHWHLASTYAKVMPLCQQVEAFILFV